MRLSVGKKKGRERGGKKEQPRANRFKLPSTSHSRFQLEACLFPFWAFRGLALYARAPPECNARGGRRCGREDERREKRGIARVDYQWTIEQHPTASSSYLLPSRPLRILTIDSAFYPSSQFIRFSETRLWQKKKRRKRSISNVFYLTEWKASTTWPVIFSNFNNSTRGTLFLLSPLFFSLEVWITWYHPRQSKTRSAKINSCCWKRSLQNEFVCSTNLYVKKAGIPQYTVHYPALSFHFIIYER